jgi:hypothetical protein
MGLRDLLDATLGLGPSDEPRAMSVEAPRASTSRPVVSTPGARVRISRDGWDGDTSRVLLLCHRRGIPVELVDGPNGLWLDGTALSAADLRDRLVDLR